MEKTTHIKITKKEDEVIADISTLFVFDIDIKQNVLNLVAQFYSVNKFESVADRDIKLFHLQENVAKAHAKLQIYNDYKDKPEVLEKYFKAIDEL